MNRKYVKRGPRIPISTYAASSRHFEKSLKCLDTVCQDAPDRDPAKCSWYYQVVYWNLAGTDKLVPMYLNMVCTRDGYTSIHQVTTIMALQINGFPPEIHL